MKVLDFLKLTLNINIADNSKNITRLIGKEKILLRYMSISETFNPTEIKSLRCSNN